MARPNSNKNSPEKVGKRALREVGGPFQEWLDDTSDAVLANLSVVLGHVLLARITSERPVATRFAPTEIETAIRRTIPELVERYDLLPGTGAVLEAVLHDYLEFLDETDRWTGTAEEFQACHEVLHEHADHEIELPQAIADAVEGVGAEEEDAAVLASFPVRAAISILQQVGDGLELEEGGDVPTEVFARAGSAAGRPDHDADGATAFIVLWIALVQMGAVTGDEQDGRRVQTTPLADLSEATDQGRARRRELLGRLLRDDAVALLSGGSPAQEFSPALLLGGVGGRPPTHEDVVETLGVVLADDDVAVAVDQVVGHLGRLGALGIVSASEPWTLDRGFWPALLWAVQTTPEV